MIWPPTETTARRAARIAMVAATFLSKGSLACSVFSWSSSSTDICPYDKPSKNSEFRSQNSEAAGGQCRSQPDAEITHHHAACHVCQSHPPGAVAYRLIGLVFE